MIPPDVASSLRTIINDPQAAAREAQAQPVAATQRITEILSNLVPGQRIFAEIQAMLPNGSYRATVAQRDVTLALPFSAKAGDSLELEVQESDGKLTLAFVTNRGEAAAKGAEQQSVATSLSSAGKLIGDLMNEIGGEGKRAAPAPLNGNLAIVASMPKDAADLAPVLKQALSQSGMFYESHQARWVAGQMPVDQLRQEPQGKIPVPAHPVPQTPAVDEPNNAKITDTRDGSPLSTLASTRAENTAQAPVPTRTDAAQSQSQVQASTLQAAQGMPRELGPLVQQQLDGLANQNFVWQGQIWPGQGMQWEIGENPEDRNYSGDQPPARWHTKVRLTLPVLGTVDASLRLQTSGDLSVRIQADSPEHETQLRDAAVSLQQQMEAAGLKLSQILISHEQA